MTGDFSKFSAFTKKDGGFFTFGDNAKKKKKIIGIGNVGNSSPPNIEDVLLVDISKITCLILVPIVFESSKCLFKGGNFYWR